MTTPDNIPNACEDIAPDERLNEPAHEAAQIHPVPSKEAQLEQCLVQFFLRRLNIESEKTDDE